MTNRRNVVENCWIVKGKPQTHSTFHHFTIHKHTKSYNHAIIYPALFLLFGIFGIFGTVTIFNVWLMGLHEMKNTCLLSLGIFWTLVTGNWQLATGNIDKC